MDSVHTPLELLDRRRPENPVAIVRPHRVEAAAKWFQAHIPGQIFYAVKANPAPWALDALWRAGVRGFDVASEAETRLVAERFPNAKLAFMHPVKSRRAIASAFHDYGVRAFAFDSAEELEKILAETNGARDLTLIVRLAVSNEGANLPLTQKFGASALEAPALLRLARQATDGQMGVSFHVGSQCMRPLAYAQAMADVSRAISRAGIVVDVVDVGGGFPAIYPGMEPPSLAAYANEISRGFEHMLVTQDAELWAEPGRALVAEAGSILARVELRKDGALYLNDGAYGNLFDAAHVGWRFPVKLMRASDAPLIPFKFYGPTCDSIDAAAGPFELPADIAEGDYIEIGMTGAYATALGTRFNGFGETEIVIAHDAPWPSLYDVVVEETPMAQVIRLDASRKSKPRSRVR
ncbi:MAG: type III PLP-dependent enzyme [Hyphomonadaceae bacterium]